MRGFAKMKKDGAKSHNLNSHLMHMDVFDFFNFWNIFDHFSNDRHFNFFDYRHFNFLNFYVWDFHLYRHLVFKTREWGKKVELINGHKDGTNLTYFNFFYDYFFLDDGNFLNFILVFDNRHLMVKLRNN